MTLRTRRGPGGADHAIAGFVDSFFLETRMALGFEPDDPAPARAALTVSLLNRAVAGLLARGFPLVRVRGEISGLTRAGSGHWYFALKDDSAQARCVMFRSRNVLVRRAPRDGDAVEVLAQVTLYEPRGEYQLNVESLRPTGQGRLYEEFLRLRERLGAEGLFEPSLKRAIPALPATIGIITSLQAAALRDVITVLERRAPYSRVVVYPVPVQGEGAGRQIASMLARASTRAEVEVLLLVRGGGSIEDLWAFNEEAVARAIRACRIPVVVGVGHEPDFTIADFAADVRAPTPTAAAELVAPDATALLHAAEMRWDHLRRARVACFESWSQRLDYATRALLAPRAPLAGLHSRVAQLALRASRIAHRQSTEDRSLLAAYSARLQHNQADIAGAQRNLRDQVGKLGKATHVAAQRAIARFDRLQAELAHLDPQAVLRRGYSVVRDERGRAISSAAQLQVGQRIGIVLNEGDAQARVERVAPTTRLTDR
jgi:exodeoxyribonuclease VII large subunit